MAIGKLKIKRKTDGSLRQFIQISGGKKIGIPAVFILSENMNNLECEFKTDKNGILWIKVGGDEIKKDMEGVQAREKKKKENEKRKKEAEAAEKTRQQTLKRVERGSYQKSSIQQEFSLADRSKLPVDTKNFLRGKEDLIDNFALRLQKGANFWEENKNRATLFQRNRGNRKKGIPEKEMRHLPGQGINYGSLPFDLLAKKTVENARLLFESECLREFQLRTDGRLIVGIGHASVFEVGVTLHHVYGIPYIPSTALKGLCRSWMIQTEFGASEALALQSKLFCDLFGCPAEWKDSDKKVHSSWYEINKKSKTESGHRKGNIIFYDAFPIEPPRVEEDVMNVHYPGYYQGKQPPTDFQSTTPITFLAVAADTPFQFVCATHSIDDQAGDSTNSILQKAHSLLVSALTSHGIGAKTALGYGFFQPADS